VPRSGPSQEDARLIAQTGVSLSQLERWRTAGALPRNERRGHGRGHGSASSAPARTAELIEALDRYVQRGRPIHEAVLIIFCAHPDLPVPEAGVRAALTWFIRDRAKGLAQAIERSLPAGTALDEKSGAKLMSQPSYDTALDAVDDYTSRLRADKDRIFRAPAWDPRIDTRRAEDALQPLMIGIVHGMDAIGLDEYLHATRELSAALGSRRQLTDHQLDRLEQKLRHRKAAGQPVFPWPAAHTTAACLTAAQTTPFGTICQVRDHLTIMAEAAAVNNVLTLLANVSPSAPLLQEPIPQRFREICRTSPHVRPYLAFPPPICAAKPTHAWQSMTSFVITTCAHPMTPTILAAAITALHPVLPHLRELAMQARPLLPETRPRSRPS
jgi:hypothetical protein